jgi:hypothetical protein
MKRVAWILAFLVALAVLLAVPLIARWTTPGPDCTGRVVIVRGPHGEPLECVCIGGTLSTCFNPGP